MSEVRNLPELDPRTTRQFYNSSHVPFEPEPNALRIQYNNKAEFKRAAKLFGLMDDFKVCREQTSSKLMSSFFLCAVWRSPHGLSGYCEFYASRLPHLPIAESSLVWLRHHLEVIPVFLFFLYICTLFTSDNALFFCYCSQI